MSPSSARRGGIGMQSRYGRITKGLAFASMTLAMLEIMHGSGQSASWVWLGAALLALGAAASWLVGRGIVSTHGREAD